MIKVIFSDIDGTLLNSRHRIDFKTEQAIQELQKNGILFVLSSSRGPLAIQPIFNRYHFSCPMVSYGGALLVEEDQTILFEDGLKKEEAKEIIDFIEEKKFPLSYNLYTKDHWFVKEKDKRIEKEENIVEVKASIGTLNSLSKEECIDKILLMVDEEKTVEVEKEMKKRFPHLSIVKSSSILIEVTKGGINKAESIKRFCQMKNISQEDTMAFGDNYNDEEMLTFVKEPVLMGNAPLPLQKKFPFITKDNDHDGIYYALKIKGLIEK